MSRTFLLTYLDETGKLGRKLTNLGIGDPKPIEIEDLGGNPDVDMRYTISVFEFGVSVFTLHTYEPPSQPTDKDATANAFITDLVGDTGGLKNLYDYICQQVDHTEKPSLLN